MDGCDVYICMRVGTCTRVWRLLGFNQRLGDLQPTPEGSSGQKA